MIETDVEESKHIPSYRGTFWGKCMAVIKKPEAY